MPADILIFHLARMPTCCVPGCRSGYSSSPKLPNVTFHNFPKDIDRRDLWIRRIHRDFIPGDAHRVCSLHFCDSDFKSTSADTNQRRKRPHEQLSRRFLKETAFPSLFENLPSYLSVEPAKEREGHATTSARFEAENARIMQQISDFQDADIIHTECTALTRLELKFLSLHFCWTFVREMRIPCQTIFFENL